jgi:hypothetical protein
MVSDRVRYSEQLCGSATSAKQGVNQSGKESCSRVAIPGAIFESRVKCRALANADAQEAPLVL